MADTKKKKKKQSQLGMIMKRLRKNKVAMTGLVILMIMILMAVFAPLIAPYDPTEMDFSSTYATPSLKHLFGCDELGRDILSRLIYGARYSLSLGLISALIGMVLGLFFGTWIGFEGGKVDMFWMRIMDIWSAIPGQLLAIVISTALGAGFVNTIIAMTIGGIPGSIRSSRAMCLKEREMEYLEAAKIINCSKFKIMYVHMLPNIVAPAIVGTTMAVGITIMGAAGLSYIGLGIQPPSPEWGAMLSAGRTYILQYPHMIVFPGIFLAITVLAINLLGDGLRDAIDPKNK
ncbi:peptide/nickel transport system permease protein [Butyrivibrio fibrisolvens]|uniref:Peptide/nickel transport system permease protein n=1 Tax=Butyrivibrio fibrisolvens TaxID=831 RepID=A0A1H9VG79_BUTFI|nr:ABC transporter permease [Butyrivibrio fibrisolvens]SES20569.1 peptide/nickel transport system permease protein [Butyrivibrio fibrisolvens]